MNPKVGGRDGSGWTSTAIFIIWSLILSISRFNSTARAACSAPPGPGFPALILEKGNPQSIEIQLKLDEAISNVLRDGDRADGAWSSNSTSFALQVTSATETLWTSYHSAALQDTNGSHVVNGDTFFRIASISKSFTVYALLLQELNLDDPVTKWLPELRADDSPSASDSDLAIHWDAITLKALASHQAGILRDSGGPCFLWRDVRELQPDLGRGGLEELGLPPIKTEDGDSSGSGCTLEDILHVARRRDRVFTPNTVATYSNVGFSLLGAVLESVTGKSFVSSVNSSILEPLGMKRTTGQKPEDSEGVIPLRHNDWNKPFGADIATAGMYSTSNDLAIYLRSLLHPATLLPQAVVNSWMKPVTWSNAGSATAYGLGWEILRTRSLTYDDRPIDLITKAGMLTGYYSTIMLIPEFQVAAVILVAGALEAHDAIRESLTSALVPVAGELLRIEASRRYTGCYASPAGTEGLSVSNSRVELVVDDRGPGLRVKEWTSLGVEFLTTYAQLQGAAHPDMESWEVRLLPSDPVMRPSTIEIWWAVLVSKQGRFHERGLWDDFCLADVDDLSYAGKPVGEIRIKIDEKGRAAEVHTVGLRTILRRESCVNQTDAEGQAYAEGQATGGKSEL